MLRLTGMLEGEGPESQGFANPTKYDAVRHGLQRIENGEGFDNKEDGQAFTQSLRVLEADVIRLAEVVVVTNSNAANEWIRSNLQL
jgi:hypothetical protein